MTLLDENKVEHLILLVGGNPLPNAVAGKLLVASGGTITLVHSKDTVHSKDPVHSKGTFEVARRLEEWLKAQQVAGAVRLIGVSESSPTCIVQRVQERLSAVNARSVGLNYTGGTKVMSVHAYRAIEQWAREQRNKGKSIKTVFSYLDARTLQLIFDPTSADSSEQREYVGRALELKLEDLLKLHGWTLQHVPTRKALLSATARALAKACGNDAGFSDWNQWIDNEFSPKCRSSDKKDWKSPKELQNVRLELPKSNHLEEVIQSLRSELGLSKDSADFGLVHSCFNNKPQRFCEWLYGKWLEHYVLDVLNELAGSLCLHECAQNIVLKEVRFEVDVIAIRGYQLFVFSCSTDTQKGLLKLKLFEAYVRARQLGGDEARVALVCCNKYPDRLEHEMRRDIDPHIRVFGREHLAKLDENLKEWILSQIGKEP